MKIIVGVTEEDISTGKRNSIKSCPVAIAMTRAFTKIGRAFTKIRVDELPETAINFIYNFDNYVYVEPFLFELEIDL